jgi:transcriptional antiterminator RfaH
MNAWYVVYCKPRQETTAHENLGRQQFNSYLPLVRKRRSFGPSSSGHAVPMFPRYLFVQLSEQQQDWSKIRSTIGVASLVTFGSKAARLPDSVISALRNREDDEGFQVLDPPELLEGDAVNIVDGPWAGFGAIFHMHSSSDRVTVLLDLASNYVRLELNASLIEKSV